MLSPGSSAGLQRALFRKKDKSEIQGTREHTSASRRQKLTFGKAFVDCVPVEIAIFARCLLSPKYVQLRTPENPVFHLELAKGLEPLTL
jgi:hypothetical protein